MIYNLYNEKRWKDDHKVVKYVHDKDYKAKKAIEEADHCVKLFRHKFNRIKDNSPVKLRGLNVFSKLY